MTESSGGEGVPELPVRVNLGSGFVVSEITIVQGTVVEGVVADADRLIARDIDALGEIVFAVGRHKVELMQILDGVQVRPGLAHGVALRAGNARPRLAD